jgi:hypothetical protein
MSRLSERAVRKMYGGVRSIRRITGARPDAERTYLLVTYALGFRLPPSPGIVTRMSDGSRRFAKPAAALGVLATMASIWWFALRPRRKIKIKTDKSSDGQ